MKSKKHQGFKTVQSKIARRLKSQRVSDESAKERAGAILAASTRRASAKAKRANPRLKKVLMPKKRGIKIKVADTDTARDVASKVGKSLKAGSKK